MKINVTLTHRGFRYVLHNHDALCTDFVQSFVSSEPMPEQIKVTVSLHRQHRCKTVWFCFEETFSYPNPASSKWAWKKNGKCPLFDPGIYDAAKLQLCRLIPNPVPKVWYKIYVNIVPA